MPATCTLAALLRCVECSVALTGQFAHMEPLPCREELFALSHMRQMSLAISIDTTRSAASSIAKGPTGLEKLKLLWAHGICCAKVGWHTTLQAPT